MKRTASAAGNNAEDDMGFPVGLVQAEMPASLDRDLGGSHAPQSTTKPLAAARKRLARRRDEGLRKRAVNMLTQRHTEANIARKLGATAGEVTAWLTDPRSQEEIASHRERVRLQIMRRTASGIIDLTMDTVEQAGRDRDAKALDAATRAALNLERLTVSAAGEAQKIDVTGSVNVDVRALLAKL